jgi:hypothetical protein
VTAGRRQAYLIVVVASLLVAACGGSSSSSSSGPATDSPSATSASSSAATTSPTGSASGSSSSSSTSAAARDRDVRLPVTFAIGAGGSLAPPEVAVPKHIDIALTVAAKDGKSHTFALKTPHEYLAAVAPGKPTRALLTGIPAGTYAVEVDSRIRGTLIVGVAPGP